VAYCQASDLLTYSGSIPAPSYLSPQKFVDDAADEIDSKIGFVYATPIDISDVAGNPVVRPARLLLKRLNVNLATGRMLLAADANGEDTQIHAYGWSLIREVVAALNNIADGDITLEGATLVTPNALNNNIPLIYNKDAESNVEAFYDRVANPNYVYPYPYGTRYINPDGVIL
jgi:hypothetical protein